LAKLSPETMRLAGGVRMVVVDSDGVLTDGRIIVSSDGTETRAFHVTDGLGIRLAQKAGLRIGIISGRHSEVLAARAAELGIQEVHQKIHEKLSCLSEILGRAKLSPSELCFIGDDLIDLPAMRLAGFSAAPADARLEVRETADYVCERDGGRGAVREVLDIVLRATGLWERVTEEYVR
jgi:3-deoxy-D-manno-octulosonate 8-phosphate phosphatase (KDO 8-P phosphatase)